MGVQPSMFRSKDVSEYIAARDRDGQYASPPLPEILWTFKGTKDGHRRHEEGDETEEIACTGGEESLAELSAVS
jgi:hypothetical protein